MPVKFSIGLGQVSTAGASQGGTSVQIFSGTVRAGILGGTEALVGVHAAQVDPTTTVSSQRSSNALHSTLFEDFRLEADAVYNFYVPDEQRTVHQDPSASLQDLPRYVALFWRPVPFRTVDIPVSRKGIRPPDPRTPSVGPAIPIDKAKVAVANGYVSPGVVSALLVRPIPAPNIVPFDEDGFLLDPTTAGASAANHLVTGSAFFTPVPDVQDNRIRANFVDPSIAGALDPNRIAVAADHTHLASLGALAKLVGGLEVISEFNQDVPLRNPPPSFPVSSDAPTLSYVGYVIERHRLDQSGSMTRDRIIDVPDPSVKSFVDRDVAYGGVYSYRIRSVVQWTHPSDVGFFGQSTFDRVPGFDTSAPSPQKRATFYAGEWSDWSRTQIIDTSPPDPPDELTVIPFSRRGLVRITWKMPADPQLDISSVVLLRARVTPDGTTDWVHLLESVPANGAYDDRDVLPFEDGHTAYLYAMYSTSFHGETSTLSEQIEVRLGRRNAREERPLLQVRPRGSDPFAHASGLPEADPQPLVALSRVAFYCREARSNHPLFNKSYVVEVQSLSTGERTEVDLSVDSTDVNLGSAGPSRQA